MTQWLDTEVERAKQLLRDYYPQDIHRLALKLSDDFGRPISADAIRNVFRRKGLGAPSTYCKRGSDARFEVTSEFEIHDVKFDDIFYSDGKQAGPFVAKIRMSGSEVRKKEAKPETENKVLVAIPDSHVPYEDKGAFAVMLAALRFLKPSITVTLGDFCECYSTSRHVKDPNRAQLLDWELAQCNARLDDIDDALSARECRRVFLQGNHEFNIQTYLRTHAAAVCNLIKIEDILRLRERGWEYVPYRQSIRIGKVRYLHDVGYCGSRAHEQTRAVVEESICMGHTHGAAVTYTGSHINGSQVAIMSGWLGSKEHCEFLAAAKVLKSWVHAFTVGVVEPDGVTHLSLVPIINGKACVFGTLIDANGPVTA